MMGTFFAVLGVIALNAAWIAFVVWLIVTLLRAMGVIA